MEFTDTTSAETHKEVMERILILKMGYLLVTMIDMHDRVAMTLQDELTESMIGGKACRVACSWIFPPWMSSIRLSAA